MTYTLIKNGKVSSEKAGAIQEIIAKYNNMYKYSIYISGKLIYVVEKNEQPRYWEVGWAE